jgi:hypothetical protein
MKSSLPSAKFFSLLRLVLLLGVIAPLMRPVQVSAQEEQRFYYWVTPHPSHQQNTESFVIEVNAASKARIDEIRAQRGAPGFAGRIAAGAVNYNKDYYAPGQPVWNWHVASIDKIFDHNGFFFLLCPPACDPKHYAMPSDIAADPEQWIQTNGDEYTPALFWILREFDPSERAAVANVSNRGMTGAGEKTLITGLIITGGEPRNVVVRALGPSLGTRGVQQFAANPRLEVYRGSSRIATNSEWATHPRAGRLAEAFPGLVPEDGKEAAIWLTLTPGAYTLHGLNEDGTEGVVLLEAFDVDSATQ